MQDAKERSVTLSAQQNTSYADYIATIFTLGVVWTFKSFCKLAEALLNCEQTLTAAAWMMISASHLLT